MIRTPAFRLSCVGRVLALCVAALCAGQTSSSVVRAQENFAGVVDRYRSGDFEGAVDAFVRRGLQNRRNRGDDTLPWPKAAVMVRTEGAFALWDKGAAGDARRQLILAEGLLDRCGRTFSRRWLLTVVAYFQFHLQLGPAQHYVDHVQLAEDPEGLVARGMLAESALASLLVAPMGRSFKISRDIPGPGGNGTIAERLGRRRLKLAEAQRHYEQALRIDPASEEAALRLGRVRWQLGEVQAARTLLSRACEGRTDPYIKYLGCLFSGRASEDLGELQDAERFYAAAATIHPEAQTAQIALARVKFVLGERRAAAAIVRDRLGVTAMDDAADPWWLYERGYASNLVDWRRELRRAAQE